MPLEVNTTITLSWAHKRFVTRMNMLFYIYIPWRHHNMEKFPVRLAFCVEKNLPPPDWFIYGWPVIVKHLIRFIFPVVKERENVYLCLFTPMMTSSNGNIFRVTGLCAGNSLVTGDFPAQRPVTRSFDSKKRLSKQSQGWWFATPSGPLWRHCNAFWYWSRIIP